MRGPKAASALCLLFLGAALVFGSVHRHGPAELRHGQGCAVCAWQASPGVAELGVSIAVPIEPMAAAQVEGDFGPFPLRELALPRTRAPPQASV